MTIVPVLSVDGEPSRELTADLLMLEIDEAVDELATMRARLADGHGLGVGTAIQVSLGTIAHQRTAFDGQISAIEFVYEDNDPPVVVVSAAGSTRPPGEPGTPLVLVRGNDLVSAHVSVHKALPFVAVNGATTGSPEMVLGGVLRLEHIGASFSGGGYRVTRIGHIFDLEHGLTTTFVAQRPI